jgi:hypothetical protein
MKNIIGSLSAAALALVLPMSQIRSVNRLAPYRSPPASIIRRTGSPPNWFELDLQTRSRADLGTWTCF